MGKKFFSGYTISLHGAVVVFGLLTLLLARENKRLEQRLYQASLAAAGGPEIQEWLPELPVTELSGGESVLAYDDLANDSVVLVFTTTCPACQQNLEHWSDLHQRFGDRYRFVAVSLDPPEATLRYAEQHALPYPVVMPADRSTFQQVYGIRSVPQTLVVGKDGRVKHVQPGVLPHTYQDRFEAG